MNEAAVQLITQDGALDALSPDTYREIYDELRQYDLAGDKYGVSLDKFVLELGAGGPTKAEWSRYHRGERELSREMRNILRRAAGLPLLNASLGEAMAAHADPNARVYKVGAQPLAQRVILLATDEALTVHANGSVALVPDTRLQEPAPAAAAQRPVQRRTAPRMHVSMPAPLYGRANALRLYFGLSWAQVIDVALESLQQRARAQTEESGNADAAPGAA